MRDISIIWEGPFRTSERIPAFLRAAVGLYLIEGHSDILYVGKSEKQGGFKRAKDHFRGTKDKPGRCICNGRDESEINLWIGYLPVGQDRSLISEAETLLIYKLQPQCNDTLKGRYYGGDLRIKNEGDLPPKLPTEEY